MPIVSPSALDGTASPVETELLEAAARPLIDAPDAALWIGFGSFISIFIIVLILIIKSRVTGPARREAVNAQFFEPAGEDAEITFDEIPAEDANVRKKRRKKNKKRDKDRKKNRGPRDAPPLEEADFVEPVNAEPAEMVSPAPEPVKVKQKRGAFSGLFAKKDKPPTPGTIDEHEIFNGEPDLDELSDVDTLPARDINRGDLDLTPIDVTHDDHHGVEEPQRADAIAREQEQERETQEAERAAYEQAEYERAEYEREQERQQVRRLTALEAERARANDDQRDAIYQAAREDAVREAEFERRKAEAALEQRMQSVAVMQRRLAEKADTLTNDAQNVSDQLSETLEERFSSLSSELETKLQKAVAPLINKEIATQNDEADPNAHAEVSQEINTLKTATIKAIDRLEARLDKISGAQEDAASLSRELAHLNTLLAERSATATAGRIQLGDIVRSILPADRYRFSEQLSTGRRADCLITMPGLSLPVPVDARFPVDAFDAYIRGEKAQAKVDAKTLYERAVLRHLVDISEHYIALGETADFAIMFIPSETIFNDLHANFPGVVQDSYRARIWVLSPTSFMATLHMMSAITSNSMPGGSAKMPEDEQTQAALLAEIKMLRERVVALENSPADESHFPDQAELVANRISREETMGDPSLSDASSRDDAGGEFKEAGRNPFRKMIENTPSDHPTQSVQAPSPRSTEEVAFQQLQEEEALAELRLNKKSARPARPPFPLR